MSKRGFFFVLLAGIIWGTSFPAVRYALFFTDFWTLTLFRFVFASLSSFIAGLIIYRKDFFNELKIMGDKYTLILSFFMFAGYITESFGQQMTTAGKASLLVVTSIIYVAIFGSLWLKEKMTKLKILGIVLGISGIIFLTIFQDPASLLGGSLLGDLFCALAGLVWGFYIIISKYYLQNVENPNSISINIGVYFYTTAILIIPSLFFMNLIIVHVFNMMVLIAGVYLGIACTLVAYIVYYKGLEDVEATTSNIILLSQVVIAIIMGILLLGESLNVFILIGSGFIIAAVILINLHEETKDGE